MQQIDLKDQEHLFETAQGFGMVEVVLGVEDGLAGRGEVTWPKVHDKYIAGFRCLSNSAAIAIYLRSIVCVHMHTRAEYIL